MKIDCRKLIEGSNKSRAFTLLELLLVIAIISVLAGLVIFNLRPATVLQNTNAVKEQEVSNQIEKSIQTYTVEKGGEYPFVTSGLKQTAYSICKQGETTNCGVNIDNLVSNGYIQNIPTNVGAEGNATGYMLKYTDKVIKIGPKKIACPTGYVGVPGNPLYQTEDFCVMKYEAKDISGVATSQAAGLLWVNVSQTAAMTACSNLGAKYHLITNREWMTIARNLEQVPSNWTSGTVGTGAVYSGHTDSVPFYALVANTDDNQGYEGTGQTAPANQRRTHDLSNGEVVWDLAGNLWEWNSDVISCAGAVCNSLEMPYDATPAEEWVEFTNLVSYGKLSYDLIRPSDVTWNATHGFGRIYTDANEATPSGYDHPFFRGGAWAGATDAGVLALRLSHASTFATTGLGFRCTVSL